MVDDAELLRRYANDHVDAAFSELVRRHLDLVYAAALRRVGGDAHRAHDITQLVFVTLAQKAARLSRHASIIGWLHTCTRYVALDLLRQEARRAAREQNAVALDLENGQETPPDWTRLRGFVDDSLDALGPADREAVLLRFFAGKSWAEVGAQLRVSEDAARKRVDVALERLRKRLARGGITSSASALAIALAEMPAVAAPAGLASSVLTAASAGVAEAGALSTSATFALFMTTAKSSLQIGILAVAATASFVGTLSLVAVSRQEHQQLAAARAERARQLYADRAEIRQLEGQIAEAKARLDAESKTAAELARSAVASAAAKAASAPAPNAPRRLSAAAQRAAAARALAANDEFRELQQREFRLRVQKEYDAFFKQMGLSPTAADALKALLVKRLEQQEKRRLEMLQQGPPPGASVSVTEDGSIAVGSQVQPGSPESQWYAETEALLGPDGFSAFRKYEHLKTYASAVDQFAFDARDQLLPLSPSQRSSLQQVFSDNSLYPGAIVAPNESTALTAKEAKVIASAAAFLTPQQLDALGRHMINERVGASIRNRIYAETRSAALAAGMGNPSPTK